jgi:hypothetical protein
MARSEPRPASALKALRASSAALRSAGDPEAGLGWGAFTAGGGIPAAPDLQPAQNLDETELAVDLGPLTVPPTSSTPEEK